MSNEEKEKLRAMADSLIETLSSDYDAAKADEVVKRVAKNIYNDLLGIPGEIEKDVDLYVAYKYKLLPNCYHAVHYIFKPEDNEQDD